MGRSILPSLKDKKRYMKISSIHENLDISVLREELKEFLGILGYSKAGINYPKKDVIRCNSSSLTDIKAALCLSNQQIIINNVSGNISRVK